MNRIYFFIIKKNENYQNLIMQDLLKSLKYFNLSTEEIYK